MSVYNNIFEIIRHESVDTFIEKLNGVKLDAITDDGRSMLHVAIAYGKQKHAEQLIIKGANLNQQDKDGQTSLHYAAIHGQLDIAHLLVKQGANLSIADKYGNIPLWYAVFNARGQYGLVSLYMNKAGGAQTINKSGKSPLDFSKQIGDLTMEKILDRE